MVKWQNLSGVLENTGDDTTKTHVKHNSGCQCALYWRHNIRQSSMSQIRYHWLYSREWFVLIIIRNYSVALLFKNQRYSTKNSWYIVIQFLSHSGSGPEQAWPPELFIHWSCVAHQPDQLTGSSHRRKWRVMLHHRAGGLHLVAGWYGTGLPRALCRHQNRSRLCLWEETYSGFWNAWLIH